MCRDQAFIDRAGNLLARGLRRRSASGLPDSSVRRERKNNTDELAFVTEIVEHDAIGGRRDFLQPERGRRERIEPRPPVGFKLGAAFMEPYLAAPTLECRIVRVETKQRREVAVPARIQPVHHQRHLIEIFSQIRYPIHAAMLRTASRGG